MPASRTVAKKPVLSNPPSGSPNAGAARPIMAETPSSPSSSLMTSRCARLSGLGELVGAVELRREHGEVGCHLHIHSGIMHFYVVDQFQAVFAVVQARAHRPAGPNGRVRAGKAEAGLVQRGDEACVVTIRNWRWTGMYRRG